LRKFTRPFDVLPTEEILPLMIATEPTTWSASSQRARDKASSTPMGRCPNVEGLMDAASSVARTAHTSSLLVWRRIAKSETT